VALADVSGFMDSGWASFEFQVERGYLLAAAGDAEAAIESFRAADLMGDISMLRLSGDPRIPESVESLRDFI
jgi:predicted negative regulator of RcsB-dependent stress response